MLAESHLLLFLVVGARRSLVSRVGWGGMDIGTVASRPPHLSGPFG
jgi:hypothetical protein